MPAFADIPFDSGGPPEMFEVHTLGKREATRKGPAAD
jgi:hypothetical protein